MSITVKVIKDSINSKTNRFKELTNEELVTNFKHDIAFYSTEVPYPFLEREIEEQMCEILKRMK